MEKRTKPFRKWRKGQKSPVTMATFKNEQIASARGNIKSGEKAGALFFQLSNHSPKLCKFRRVAQKRVSGFKKMKSV